MRLLYDEAPSSISLPRWTHIATPEEIKASHGKCETCKYFFVDYDGSENPGGYICIAHSRGIDYPDTDYCNHHEPKE